MIMRNEVTYPIALIEMVDFRRSQLRHNFYLKKDRQREGKIESEA